MLAQKEKEQRPLCRGSKICDCMEVSEATEDLPGRLDSFDQTFSTRFSKNIEKVLFRNQQVQAFEEQ
jgi:hypothetical protein